jgi:peptidoglycan-associated lipoprotein
MLEIIRKGVLLLAIALSMGLVAQAQRPPESSRTTDVDVAITYVAERAKIASIDCGCFWLNGGSGNFALTFFHGLGVAGDLTGVHGANVAPGVDLDKVMFAMGPRYTYEPKVWLNRRTGKHPTYAIFGEALFGGVHGFNTIFPSSTGVRGEASSFATQFGGGLDLRFARHIGIRVVQVDFLRSTLPNNAGDVQHDLKIAGGISFHFSPKS